MGKGIYKVMVFVISLTNAQRFHVQRSDMHENAFRLRTLAQDDLILPRFRLGGSPSGSVVYGYDF
jgi:hypothetical protein